ncbi:MAG: helix-turn-helix transcriptional regulator [Acidimicrobiales bacterium]
MPEHHFQLIIDGALDDHRLDALVDAGCDDATYSTKGNLTFADFDRQAPTLRDAITSAITAIDSVEVLRVRRVEPDELVWAAEIAERTGRTRASIDLLIKGKRGPGGFPPPASHATRNPLWRWAEVENWFALYEGREVDSERSAVIVAVNGVLEARHGLRASRQADELRPALQRLLTS